MGNRYCENQGFVIGNSLAMQCHVEMTTELIETWCETCAEELAESKASPAVQSAEQMRRGMTEKLEALRIVASRLYDRWAEGLKGARDEGRVRAGSKGKSPRSSSLGPGELQVGSSSAQGGGGAK